MDKMRIDNVKKKEEEMKQIMEMTDVQLRDFEFEYSINDLLDVCVRIGKTRVISRASDVRENDDFYKVEEKNEESGSSMFCCWKNGNPVSNS